MEGKDLNRVDVLREATLGTSVARQRVIVEHNGEALEVRQPTVRERTEILRMSRIMVLDPKTGQMSDKDIDVGLMLIHAAIRCTVVPGTDKPVFSVHDVEAMKNSLTGGFVDQLGEQALTLMNVAAPNAQPPSLATTSAEPSTP